MKLYNSKFSSVKSLIWLLLTLLFVGCFSFRSALAQTGDVDVARVNGADLSLEEIRKSILDSNSSPELKLTYFDALISFPSARVMPILEEIVDTKQPNLSDLALIEIINSPMEVKVKYMEEKVDELPDTGKIGVIDTVYRRFNDPTFRLTDKHFKAVGQAVRSLTKSLSAQRDAHLTDSESYNDGLSMAVDGCNILSLRKTPDNINIVNGFVEEFPSADGLLAPAAGKWLALAKLGKVSEKNLDWARKYLSNPKANYITRIAVATAIAKVDSNARLIVVNAMKNFIANPGYFGNATPLYGIEGVSAQQFKSLKPPYFGQKFLSMSSLGVLNVPEAGELLRQSLKSPSPFIRDKGLTLWAAKYPDEFAKAYKGGTLKSFPKRRIDMLARYISQTRPDVRSFILKNWKKEYLSNIDQLLQSEGIPYRYCSIGSVSDD